MKHLFFLTTLLVALCGNDAQAQQYIISLISRYPVVNQPHATLAQILDTLNAHSNPADTIEGEPWTN